jgi:hypothetical protein
MGTIDDVAQITAWARVVNDVLRSAPRELIDEILEAAGEERDKQQRRPVILSGSRAELTTPAERLVYERCLSRVVQVMVRKIVNGHSPQDAGAILFQHHAHASGSGLLVDYLEHLPGVRIDRGVVALVAGQDDPKE